MSPTEYNAKFAFDPMDATRAKDWSLLEQIRQEQPVVRPADGVVFTSLYKDTNQVFRDAKRFSSAGDMRAPGVVVPEEERFLGEIDPPLHPKIRRLLLRGFTARAAADAEDWTRANVKQRLHKIAMEGQGDLMATLAIPLPGSVAAHALGIPDELHDQVMEWCSELLHSTWPAQGKTERGEGIAGSFPEFASVLDELIVARRTDRDDEYSDLLGVMIRSEDASGWKLSEQHVRTLTVNILAGSLSASYMLGNLLYRYVTDVPGFAETLANDRTLIPVGVEESLRFEAPVTFLFRTAMEDSEIGECPVGRGEHVMLGIASANRDESVYPDGEAFRLDRESPPEHLAFGAGPHLCLGNHLTRMVGAVVLEEVINLFPPGALHLAPNYVWHCVDHPLEYGPESLDVVLPKQD